MSPSRARAHALILFSLVVLLGGQAAPAAAESPTPAPAGSPAAAPPPLDPAPAGSPAAAPPSPTPAPTALPGASPGAAPLAAPLAAGTAIVLPQAGSVTATVVGASAAYTSDFGLDQPTHVLLLANATGQVGTTVPVGTFAAGTSLVFYIYVENTATTYLSTSDHAQVTASSATSWTIGWEDGTDFDYNDLVTQITLTPSGPAAPGAAESFGTGSGAFGPSWVARHAEPVNTASGNYDTQVTDLSMPGRGISLAFTRTYNSLDPTVGPLGPGWSFSYGAHLAFDAAGNATFFADDGAQYVFAANGSGGFVTPPGSTARLAPETGGYVLTRQDQLAYHFSPGGALLSEADRNGNTITLAHDTSGQLTTITDTVGRVVTLAWTNGRLTGLSDPIGRTVAYGYTSARQLASVTDVRGGTTSYTYDAAGRLATITDQNGHPLVTNTYDPTTGRVVTQQDALGDTTSFAWNAATTTSTMTDARGGVWTDMYANGLLTSSSDPLGDTTSYTYDPGLNTTSVTDPDGHTTTMTYDASGNLLTRTAPAPLSYVETFTYDAANDLLSHTDGRGNTTSYAYDAAGNLTTTTYPDGGTSSATYDPHGQLLSSTDQRGNTTTYGYDASGDLASITSPLGERTTMTYDPVGRLLTRVDPRGNVAGGNPAQYTTTIAYDAANDLVATTDPLGHVTSTTFDPAGNRTSVTDPNGHATSYAYDAANHLVSVTDALHDVTRYTYDATNDLASRTDANGHLTTYAYDLADRLTTTTDPDGHTWTVAYDAAGNQTAMTDANGNATTYAYDALNRLTGVTYANGSTAPVTYAYDADGNRTSMTDGAGTETFTYDTLNRLTADTRGANVFTYTYDPAGNLLSRTYPDGTLTAYTYDADGRLASATSGGTTSTYAYDPAGNPLSVATPDGFTTADTYDAAGRLTGVATTSSAGLLSSFAYTLDPAGNRTAMVTSRDTMVYTYDAADRLTGVCYSNCGTAAPAAVTLLPAVLPDRPPEDNPPPPGDTFTTWTYDAVGNRLTQTNYLGTTAYAYDPADRLTSVTPPGSSPVGYTYDANGNQRSAGASTYAYNLANALVSASVGTTTQTYSYAGDGIRLSAATGSQAAKTTQYVVDRAFALPTVVAERDGGGKLIRRYSYGLALLSQSTPNKGPYWYHADGLGSVSDITSSSGTPLWWAEYQPYGLLRESGATSQAPLNPFLFTGQYQDVPTGLYYLRARQYDPTTGRFLAVDPVAQPTTLPALGTYTYAAQNPVLHTDPSGKDNPLCIALAIALVEGGPVDLAVLGVCLGASALVGYGAVQLQQVLQRQLSNVEWPLKPNGTLEEPPFTNTAPRPAPPGFPFYWKCTPVVRLMICVTMAGTLVIYNSVSSAPKPEPGPPPPAPPTPVPAPPVGSNRK